MPLGFFERMAHAGGLAPSGDNLQPWSFIRSGETLHVQHDSYRDRSLFNVEHLASFIALGAVLENVAIAASAEGYDAEIELIDQSIESWCARISFAPGARADPLASFLDRRCTNRKPYRDQPLATQVRDALDIGSRYSSTRTFWLEGFERLSALGRLVARADRLIFENERIHAHLFSTIRWTQSEVERTRDGLPIASLELGKSGSFGFRRLAKWRLVKFLNFFGFSRAAARHSLFLMRQCSAAGLVTASEASPTGFMEAGRAFQRIWLQATREGLALQPMTAIIFLQLKSRLGDYSGLSAAQISTVDFLRTELQHFFSLPDSTVPAMLLRLGYGAAPSARTIRRKFVLGAG